MLSAANALLQVRRVTIALNLDGGQRLADVGQILRAQADSCRADVFFQPVDLRRAGDRYDPLLLREQPGDGDLGAAHALAHGEVAEHLNQPAVGTSGVFAESWHHVTEVRRIEFRVLVDRAAGG